MIIHGDSYTEIDNIGNNIDLIIIDPPYIIRTRERSEYEMTKGYVSNHSISKDSHKVYQKLKGSKLDKGFDTSIIERLFKKQKKVNMYCFCSNYQISKLMSIGENYGVNTILLVWHKYNAIPLTYSNYRSDAEFIIHYRGKGCTFNHTDIKYKTKVKKYPIKSKLHINEKPIGLIKELIEVSSKKGDTVLDCFAGSGTTAAACIETGRKYILIENNIDNIKIINDRINNYNEMLIV